MYTTKKNFHLKKAHAYYYHYWESLGCAFKYKKYPVIKNESKHSAEVKICLTIYQPLSDLTIVIYFRQEAAVWHL